MNGSELKNIPKMDTSGMDAVIDMAMNIFQIDDDGRKKLEILFTAYTSEYMKQTCRLSWQYEVGQNETD